MISSRSTHYWLWFLLFGVIAAIVAAYNNQSVTSETGIFLLTGFLGLLTGFGAFSRFARAYDLLIGLFFTVVGVLGIMNGLGFHLVASGGTAASTTLTGDSILGLYLGLPYALIHTVLGLTSLNHGLKAPTSAPVAVATATPANV
jgi:uncharacterized membrane protein HdeD (DUF308 family)